MAEGVGPLGPSHYRFHQRRNRSPPPPRLPVNAVGDRSQSQALVTNARPEGQRSYIFCMRKNALILDHLLSDKATTMTTNACSLLCIVAPQFVRPKSHLFATSSSVVLDGLKTFSYSHISYLQTLLAPTSPALLNSRGLDSFCTPFRLAAFPPLWCALPTLDLVSSTEYHMEWCTYFPFLCSCLLECASLLSLYDYERRRRAV